MYHEEDRVKDPFLSDYLAIQRIVMEWVEHRNLIIAYDYDNTVFDYHQKGYTFHYIEDALRDAKKIGATFIVYSCSPKSRHQEMREYLTSRNLPCDYINESYIELADGSGKVFYNILLDDRAGLRASYITLNYAIEVMKQNPKDSEEACNILKDRFGIKNCEF